MNMVIIEWQYLVGIRWKGLISLSTTLDGMWERYNDLFGKAFLSALEFYGRRHIEMRARPPSTMTWLANTMRFVQRGNKLLYHGYITRSTDWNISVPNVGLVYHASIFTHDGAFKFHPVHPRACQTLLFESQWLYMVSLHWYKHISVFS